MKFALLKAIYKAAENYEISSLENRDGFFRVSQMYDRLIKATVGNEPFKSSTEFQELEKLAENPQIKELFEKPKAKKLSTIIKSKLLQLIKHNKDQ